MTVTELEIVEHLDWEYVQPCEHSRHEATHRDEPARYLLAGTCIGCGENLGYFICESGWERLGRGKLRCRDCGILTYRDEALRIVRVIGGG